MDSFYVSFGAALFIQLLILSNICAYSSEKYGMQKERFYPRNIKDQSLFNKQSRILQSLSGTNKQSSSYTTGYNVKSAKKGFMHIDDAARNTKEFVCPEGYRKRVTTDGQTFCSPIFTEHEILKANQPHCADGQMFDGLRCINIEQSPNQKHSGHNNKVAPKHYHFSELKSGSKNDKTSADETVCENGKVAAMSENGIICIEPVFPSSVCPEDRVPVITSLGIDCLPCPYGQQVVNVESGVKCENMDIVTTETPCPQGLQTVQTPFGRVCQYVPPTTSREGKGCPDGKLKHAAGNPICMDDRFCPYGQIEMNNEDGTINCLTPENIDASLCLEGEIFYEDACIPIYLAEKFQSGSKSPCQFGHVLVVSNFGSVCQPASDVSKVIQNYHCTKGTILKQTEGGFQCLQGAIPPYVIPMCDKESVIAMLGETYGCISKYDANLVCSVDEIMVRVDAGFVCKANCGPDDFYYIDKDLTKKCLTQQQASDVCGDGYMAIRDKESFLCRKLREDVQCPVGYFLSFKDGRPLCIQEGENCLGDGGHSVPECLYESPYCQQGYNLTIDFDMDVPYCQFISYPLFRQPGTGTTCDESVSLRPCDFSEELLLGCNPDCANGGTCVNNTCHCPPGISGHACYIDVNECENRPCQHGCVNTFGSYQCTCPTGMVLSEDGRTCADEVCIPDCLNNGDCVRGQCRCKNGFEGDYCQIDKDECLKYGDRLCQYRCRNTYGSYKCICPPDSSLNPDGRTCLNRTCIPTCRNGGSCHEHRCYCPRGFYGIICQFDVNECRKAEHQCSQTCNNTWGSYVCSCKKGYALHTDGKTCIQVGET